MKHLVRTHARLFCLVGALLAGAVLGGLVILVTPLRFSNLLEPQINEITPANFYAEFIKDPNNYIFIDVRTNSNYVEEHPLGTINMPLESLYDQRHYLPKSGKTIVLICGSNASSGVAFSYLQHFGFSNILRVTNGLPAWKASGLPTVLNSNNPYGTSTPLSSPLSLLSLPRQG